jgi:hypothetical protein
MIPARYVAMNAVDASKNETQAVPMPADHVLSASIHAVVTGTAAGTLKVQVSNDPPGNAVTNWVDLSGASVSTSGAGNYLIPKFDVSYEWIQLVYTKSSGTGTLTATIKTIGF